MSFEPDPDFGLEIRTKEDAWREKAAFDFDLDVSYEAIRVAVEQAIEGESIESVRIYLGTYGDTVTTRVRNNLTEANDLLKLGHAGPALTLACSAIELTVRYLVIRPLVQGAFLSNEWAAILTDKIIRDRPGEGRDILPAVVQAWGLDLDAVRLGDGRMAWGVFTGSALPARNRFVHTGESVSSEMAGSSVECAEALLFRLVAAIAERVGLRWPAHPWHVSYRSDAFVIRSFEPLDPFLPVSPVIRPRRSNRSYPPLPSAPNPPRG